MSRVVRAALAAITLAGCAAERPSSAPATHATPSTAGTPTAADASSPRAEVATPHAADAGVGTAAAPARLPFIEDDYPRALAEARARHLPLFVDAWAPWCHSCLSLKAYVFSDARVIAKAGELVWLSLDTEKKANAPFLARFPLEVLPTLYVIDPTTEAARVKWPGTLTANELVDLLDDARGDGTGAGAGAKLLQADRDAAAGKRDASIDGYRAALAEGPAGWSRRGRALDALVTQLAAKGDREACMREAREGGPHLDPGTARVDVAVSGASCAIEALGDAAAAKATRAVARSDAPALLAELVTLTSDLALPLVADDRSGAFEARVDLLHALGDAAGAKVAGRSWATFLEGEAARAPSPAARTVFDSHRLLAYLEIGEPARAIPMLEQSARDFPADYNPHVRLARALTEMRNWDAAVREVDLGLGRAYGPRKLRIFVQKADIQAAQHDVVGERATLAQAVAYADTVPLREGYRKLRDQIRARLARLPP